MKNKITAIISIVLAVCVAAVVILWRTESADKQKTIDTLQEEAKGQALQIETLTADAAEKALQVETLSADAADKALQVETLTADAAEKAGQIETLTADAADKAAQIENLTADAAEKAGQIETLNAAMAEKDVQIADLTAASAQKDAQIETLTADVNDKAAQITSLTAESSEKAAQVDQLLKDAEVKAAQIETLSADIAEKAVEIAALQAGAPQAGDDLAAVEEGTFTTSKRFVQQLKAHDFKYTFTPGAETSDGDDKFVMLLVSESAEGVEFQYRIYTWFSEAGSMHVRVWNVITFDPADLENVKAVCNDLSSAYMYLKFYPDESDFTVTAAFDTLVTDSPEMGEAMWELMIKTDNVLSAAYDTLLKYAVEE